nr:MAG TPA: hypothetical protein [Caudoviricetes sp.]
MTWRNTTYLLLLHLHAPTTTTLLLQYLITVRLLTLYTALVSVPYK